MRQRRRSNLIKLHQFCQKSQTYSKLQTETCGMKHNMFDAGHAVKNIYKKKNACKLNLYLRKQIGWI